MKRRDIGSISRRAPLRRYMNYIIYVYVCMYTDIDMYICMYVCIYIYIYISIYLYISVCIYIYIHIYICTYLMRPRAVSSPVTLR